MSSGQSSANAGQKTGNFLKEGLTKIHGLGEAIRGNVNTFADDITNTNDTRSRAEVDRGVKEMRTGHYEGAHTAGVTPADNAQERAQEPVVAGHATTGTTTGGLSGSTGTTGHSSTTGTAGVPGTTSGGLAGTAETTGTTGPAGSTGTTRYA